MGLIRQRDVQAHLEERCENAGGEGGILNAVDSTGLGISLKKFNWLDGKSKAKNGSRSVTVSDRVELSADRRFDRMKSESEILQQLSVLPCSLVSQNRTP